MTRQNFNQTTLTLTHSRLPGVSSRTAWSTVLPDDDFEAAAHQLPSVRPNRPQRTRLVLARSWSDGSNPDACSATHCVSMHVHSSTVEKKNQSKSWKMAIRLVWVGGANCKSNESTHGELGNVSLRDGAGIAKIRNNSALVQRSGRWDAAGNQSDQSQEKQRYWQGLVHFRGFWEKRLSKNIYIYLKK